MAAPLPETLVNNFSLVSANYTGISFAPAAADSPAIQLKLNATSWQLHGGGEREYDYARSSTGLASALTIGKALMFSTGEVNQLQRES